MIHDSRKPPTREDWSRVASRVDPRVVTVPPRLIRRLSRYESFERASRRRGGVPTLAIVTDDVALSVFDRDELGIAPGAAPPKCLVLVSNDEGGWDRVERLIFEAAALIELRAKADSGDLHEGLVDERIRNIGRTAFEECRYVLKEDGLIRRRETDPHAYIGFVVEFLSLRVFAPELVVEVFPSLGDESRVHEIVHRDLDEVALLERIRGALPEEARAPEPTPSEEAAPDARSGPATSRRDEKLAAFIERRSERLASTGNHVRAALIWKDAGKRGLGTKADKEATARLEELARRLRTDLRLEKSESTRWKQALPTLLAGAARNAWPQESRLLFDLQKVCYHAEHEVESVRPFDWLLSLGKKPLTRALPYQREILMIRSLRSASKRLAACRLADVDRNRLDGLIRHALEAIEERLRGEIRPLIVDAFDRSGIIPDNLPESVARDKVIEELLDRVVEYGFLGMGHLRDAISRNELRLPDLEGVAAFLQGDHLLRSDKDLSVRLEGIHRRGEIYLRWLQRASSLAFGTKFGRLATKYVILPFGGSYLILEGLQHTVVLLIELATELEPELLSLESFLVLAVLLLGVINFPAFRAGFLKFCRFLGRNIKRVFLDFPRALMRLPIVRAVLESPIFRWAWSWGVKPGVVAGAIVWLGIAYEWSYLQTTLSRGGLFIALSAAMNTRPGRDVAEIVSDACVSVGRGLLADLIPGLFRFVVETFDAIMEQVDRAIYSVDEKLRYRESDSRLALGFKAVANPVWFVVTYVARLYLNVLIEPQVNPIKHFPVVTVSHKIILPYTFTLMKILRAPFLPLGRWVADILGSATVFLLPGMFGFFVWEFKENWKIYEANRARSLRALLIGGHGETMARFLRRGFHSGTVPKQFAKLRKAARPEASGRNARAAQKARHTLRHSRESIRRYVERTFTSLLGRGRTLGKRVLEVGEIRLSPTRIVVEIHEAEREGAPAPLLVAFEEHDGLLVGVVDSLGWAEELSEVERTVLNTALAGMYKTSAVDLVREFSPVEVRSFLRTWSGRGDEKRPTLPRSLSFSSIDIPWYEWVKTWDDDAAGSGHSAPYLKEKTFLPAESFI